MIGARDGTLKIRLQAPPVEGKANIALLRFLADRLQVPKSAVRLTHGRASRRKLVEIGTAGLTPDGVASRLAEVGLDAGGSAGDGGDAV